MNTWRALLRSRPIVILIVAMLLALAVILLTVDARMGGGTLLHQQAMHYWGRALHVHVHG